MNSPLDLSRQPYVNHIYEVFESSFQIEDFSLGYLDIERALLKYFAEEDEIASIFNKEANYWRASSEFIRDAINDLSEGEFSESLLNEDLKFWLDSRLKRYVAHEDKLVIKMLPGGGATVVDISCYL